MAAAIGLTFAGGSHSLAGDEPTKPKPGTYAGAGILVGNPDYGMQVGFRFRGAEVDVRILGFSFPNCSGFTSVPVAPVEANRFDTTSTTGPPAEENRLKGRFVGPSTVKGSLRLIRDDAASCGDPETYKYKYTAERYGRP